MAKTQDNLRAVPMILASISKIARGISLIFALAALTLTFTGCVYRFTNRYVELPQGVRTIAFEAVYDTSREVIPHDILWTEFQKAFARNGRLLLVGQDGADALLRIHLKNAVHRPSGSSVGLTPSEDTEVMKGRNEPPNPAGSFRNLNTAGKYSDRDILSMAMDVEVWNLYTKKIILERSYSSVADYLSIRSDNKINGFLRSEEALDANMERLSASIAGNVVNDLLVRL